MSDTTAQAIIDQCNGFIESSEENYLITVFNNKIKEVKGLGEEEIKKYTSSNEKAVKILSCLLTRIWLMPL